VFSDDMFEARFLKEGVMNPKTGADYRRCILNVGGTKVNCLRYQEYYSLLTVFLVGCFRNAERVSWTRSNF